VLGVIRCSADADEVAGIRVLIADLLVT